MIQNIFVVEKSTNFLRFRNDRNYIVYFNVIILINLLVRRNASNYLNLFLSYLRLSVLGAVPLIQFTSTLIYHSKEME